MTIYLQDSESVVCHWQTFHTFFCAPEEGVAERMVQAGLTLSLEWSVFIFCLT